MQYSDCTYSSCNGLSYTLHDARPLLMGITSEPSEGATFGITQRLAVIIQKTTVLFTSVACSELPFQILPSWPLLPRQVLRMDTSARP